MTELDADGQPLNAALNWKKNVAKQLNQLKGILVGISADRDLNETELSFLQTWLMNSLLPNKSDVFDLRDQIASVLEDGRLDVDEKNDTLALLDDILEFGDFGIETKSSSRINVLLGVLSGISSDGVVSEAEVLELDSWLKQNSSARDAWQYDKVSRVVARVLQDGIVTSEERESLRQLFDEISGYEFSETGSSDSRTASGFFDNPDQINVRGLSFLVTGKFVCVERKTLVQELLNAGAKLQKSITNETRLLIVGQYASRDWLNGNCGTKINNALARREKGQSIAIISEETFLPLLEAN